MPALSGLPSLCGQVCVNLSFLPLYVRNLLSQAAFRIFSLSLKFASFTIICQGVDYILLIWGRSSFLDMNACFLLQIREVPAMIFSNILSGPLSLSMFSGIPIRWMLFFFKLSLNSWILSLLVLCCFSLFSLASFLYINLSSMSLTLSSASFTLAGREFSLDCISGYFYFWLDQISFMQQEILQSLLFFFKIHQ